MSRVEPTHSTDPKRYGDPRRTRDERVAKKPSQTEGDEHSPRVTKTQRVELKIRGVGRTSGLVEEIEDGSILVALVVCATPDVMALEAPDAILEYTTLRGLYRQKGYASYNGLDGEKVRFVSDEEPELMQRREFVRVGVNIPVQVSLKDNPWPTEFDALIKKEIASNIALVAAAGLKFN